MKVLATVLLFSGFIFLSAVGSAQDILGISNNCEIPPALTELTVEKSVWIDNQLIEEVSPQIVSILEDRVNCLNGNLLKLDTSFEKFQFSLTSSEDVATDNLLLQDKLKQTELDLHTDEARIEAMESRLHLIEQRLDMAEDEIEWLTPKNPVRKPKIPGKPKAGGVILH
jgi:hypothetical protein